MPSSLLVLLLLSGLGIGGNILCDAQSEFCSGNCKSCGTSWTLHRGRCYLFTSTEMTWSDADDYCVNYYGHLASFHDQDEYDFIRSLIVGATGTNTTAWVGGTKGKDGVWKWSDRSEFSYTHWGKGEPNNLGEQENCMAINMNGQDYVSDEVCSHKHAFVCS